MPNDRNSKIQKMPRPGRFWSLNVEICDLFVIWCFEFVILDTKPQGRTVYLRPSILGAGKAQRIRFFKIK